MVHVELPGNEVSPDESLNELSSLIEAAQVTPVGYVKQKRHKIHPPLYVGKGKAQEIAEVVERLGVNVVIFDNDLSPAQIRELEEIVKVKVIDRSELILDIFATRASSAEARMQVELAQLEYTYPRLTRMWGHLDTVTAGAATGGVGTRGTGESQLEIDRRLVNKRIAALTRLIRDIDTRKTRQVRSRHQHYTVSLVGYTNAGKSTLLNTATGSSAYAADQLFATLDTKTARWNLDKDLYVLLSDTVGFVRDLPHHLIASFRATLEEAIHADLLLHVVDISHPLAYRQVEAVNQVLDELGCHHKDIILVANKIDMPGAVSQFESFRTIYPETVGISAHSGNGFENLVEKVIERVTGDKICLRVKCAHNDGRTPSYLRAHGQILQQNYLESHAEYEAILGRRQLPGLEHLRPISYEILDHPNPIAS